MRVPLTQKARGVIAMKLYGPWSEFVPEFRLVQTEAHAQSVPIMMGGSKPFGRFCPPRPEHGYIDSRVVKDRVDLLSMLEQTKNVHENSEIMLMPNYGSGELLGSFVWTPAKVTLGSGNDGATAGKEGCRTLPLVPAQVPKELLEAAGVPPDQSPYIEGLVTDCKKPVLVQLRYGPEPPLSMDFVPQTMRVKKVVKAEGDLMVFGEMVKGLEEGTVVDHFGGSLTSHFGVHCLTNKVPIVTSFRPEVGQRLEQVEQKMPKHDPQKVADWYCFGMRDARSRNWRMSEMESACNAALWILHNAAALGEYPELVGSALAILVKLCVIACHGESRHLNGDAEAGNGRLTVFIKKLKKSSDALAALPQKRELFESMGTLPTGVGGQPWAHCATVTIDLVEMLRELVREPTSERLMGVISQANAVVNEAHNGGWWLNKFTVEEVFDACSIGAPHAVGYAFEGIQGIFTTIQQTKGNVYKRVAGFKKKELLGLPVMERRPVQMRGFSELQFLLNPVQGKVYAVGKRVGWAVDAPAEMVEDVRNGDVLPLFHRKTDSAKMQVEDGDVVTLRTVLQNHTLTGAAKDYQVEFKNVVMFDAREVTEFVSQSSLERAIARYLMGIGGSGTAMLCEMCFCVRTGNRAIVLPYVCNACSGKAEEKPRCACGEYATVVTQVGAPVGDGMLLCWKCAWKMAVEVHTEKMNEMAEAKQNREKKLLAIRAMCGVPDCSTAMPVQRMSNMHGAYGCGCQYLKEGYISLTLESLKGLNTVEQEKQKA